MKTLKDVLFVLVILFETLPTMSILSWSNVPEPTKTLQEWSVLIGTLLVFPLLWAIVRDSEK